MLLEMNASRFLVSSSKISWGLRKRKCKIWKIWRASWCFPSTSYHHIFFSGQCSYKTCIQKGKNPVLILCPWEEASINSLSYENIRIYVNNKNYIYIDDNKSWEKLNALLKLQNLLAKAKLKESAIPWH